MVTKSDYYTNSTPRQIYSRVKLTYADFTPLAKPSHVRTTLLTQNKPSKILLGVNFAYAQLTPIPNFCLLDGVKKKRKVKTLAKSAPLG